MKMQNPVFVALDIDDAQAAVELAGRLSGAVGGFKLGPRLLVRHGATLVEAIAKCGQVFVDNKYFDIPNTMDSAVRATFTAGATYCTVHAQSGSDALERLARVEAELNEKRPFQVLSVTVLTSFSEKTLAPTVIKEPIASQVKMLADLTFTSGLSGVVCSPYEVGALKASHTNGFFVTPGVRLEAVKDDDQKRVMTPSEALGQGASALVIGRPIVQAADPVKAAEAILAKL